jgi:hypothetical protein
MDDTPANETELEVSEPRIRFFDRLWVQRISLVAVVLVLLLAIGLMFDSSYFRF